jgi:hypothetical protein
VVRLNVAIMSEFLDSRWCPSPWWSSTFSSTATMAEFVLSRANLLRLFTAPSPSIAEAHFMVLIGNFLDIVSSDGTVAIVDMANSLRCVCRLLAENFGLGERYRQEDHNGQNNNYTCPQRAFD